MNQLEREALEAYALTEHLMGKTRFGSVLGLLREALWAILTALINLIFKRKPEMKTLFSLAGGALTLTENAGVVALSFDEALGGGAAAGIVSGKGQIELNGEQGLQLAEKLLNAHLPASVLPLATVIEGVVNQAIKALE